MMLNYKLIEIEDKDKWDSFIDSFDHVHGFQLYEWGEVKRIQGWKPLRLALIKDDKIIIALQILSKSIMGFSIGQSPFGPVCDSQKVSKEEWKLFFRELNYYLKSKKIITLIFQPYFNLDLCQYSNLIRKVPFLLVYAKTYVINLEPDLEDIFNSFNSKTRTQIRKSIRDGLITIEIDNSERGFERFYKLYEETYFRTKAVPLRKEIFREMSKIFEKPKHLNIFFAKVSNINASTIIVLSSGKTAVYQWAASSSNPEIRKLNTQRRLVWEVVKYYKQNKYKIFDLGGIPDEEDIDRNSKHYGIYEFKSFFGEKVYENSGVYIISTFPTWFISNAIRLQELFKMLRGWR